MKIHQLPMGSRFEYAGEVLVKTGPLIGTGPSGQRLIPKYVVLKVLDAQTAVAAAIAAPLSRETVLAAFERFHADCLGWVPPEGQQSVQAARERFFEAIGR